MSKHWKPPETGKIVRIRPVRGRRNWVRVHSYWHEEVRSRPLPDGARAGLVLVAAACLGVAVGAYQAFGPNEPIAPGAEAQWSDRQTEIIIPDVASEAADVEWAGRADGDSPRSSTGTARATGGVRAAFGYCHSGGGSNCVVDGDTFYLGGDKVRIAGIDAPETHPPRCAYEARLGRQATEQLQSLLNSGAVMMTGIERDRDKYGRLLRNVSVGGRDVGEAMIAAGVARPYVSGRRGWC